MRGKLSIVITIIIVILIIACCIGVYFCIEKIMDTETETLEVISDESVNIVTDNLMNIR